MKRRKKSAKKTLLTYIYSNSRRAAKLRLAGRINLAQFYERHVDSATKEAERNGWADDDFEAETAGQQAAH